MKFQNGFDLFLLPAISAAHCATYYTMLTQKK